MSQLSFILLALISFLAVILAIYNNNAVVKSYTLKSEKIKGRLRVVLLTDLHNKKYNPSNIYITDKVAALSPDMIIISGDFVDRMRTDFNIAKQTLDGLRRIAPVYYAFGNHEKSLGRDNVIQKLDCKDVLLENEYKIFEHYSVLGLSDGIEKQENRIAVLSVFEKLKNYKILVVHRPYEFFSGLNIKDRDIDLVLCGHEHGGLIRIPFFGALFTHEEGFFPKYSKGAYTENGTTMVLSGGIGNTMPPFRINNFPEIVKIDIEEN